MSLFEVSFGVAVVSVFVGWAAALVGEGELADDEEDEEDDEDREEELLEEAELDADEEEEETGRKKGKRGKEEDEEEGATGRGSTGRGTTVSPAIEAWGFPLIYAYGMERRNGGREEAKSMKAAAMKEYDKSSLSDPQDQVHLIKDGKPFYTPEVTRGKLRLVSSHSTSSG